MEDRTLIRRNIDEYNAVLQRDLPRSVRLALCQLLVDEITKLSQAERREEINQEELVT